MIQKWLALDVHETGLEFWHEGQSLELTLRSWADGKRDGILRTELPIELTGRFYLFLSDLGGSMPESWHVGNGERAGIYEWMKENEDLMQFTIAVNQKIQGTWKHHEIYWVSKLTQNTIAKPQDTSQYDIRHTLWLPQRRLILTYDGYGLEPEN